MSFLIKAFQVAVLLFKYIRPIFFDLMRIIREVNTLGLDNGEARKKVFQDITDFIQKNGMKNVPDSILNAAIELAYQIYLLDKKQGETK